MKNIFFISHKLVISEKNYNKESSHLGKIFKYLKKERKNFLLKISIFDKSTALSNHLQHVELHIFTWSNKKQKFKQSVKLKRGGKYSNVDNKWHAKRILINIFSPLDLDDDDDDIKSKIWIATGTLYKRNKLP